MTRWQMRKEEIAPEIDPSKVHRITPEYLTKIEGIHGGRLPKILRETYGEHEGKRLQGIADGILDRRLDKARFLDLFRIHHAIVSEFDRVSKAEEKAHKDARYSSQPPADKADKASPAP